MEKRKISFTNIPGKALKLFRNIIIFLGSLALIMLILSFTSLPYHVYHWLGTHNAELDTPPDYIVVMGAGGMPGPGGLMRSHFAAEAALIFEDAKIIIALPTDTTHFYGSDAYRMFRQMMLMDLDSSRFLFETNGTNTYTQAVEIRRILSKTPDRSLLIVSSPEHIRRCLLTFRKCGFEHVGGLPTFEAAFSIDLLLTEEEREKSVQPVDRRVDFRYNMWNYLHLQIMVLREFTALGYYSLKGYI